MVAEEKTIVEPQCESVGRCIIHAGLVGYVVDRYFRDTHTFGYGHSTERTPVLVRSPKLSSVAPG